jgi:predicted nucleotidyltransferase
MEPEEYRQRVKGAIVSALRVRDDVAGCWEGGSAATGRLDEFSDIDLVIVAPLDELTRQLKTTTL